MKYSLRVIIFLTSGCFAEDCSSLFRDLALVEEIDFHLNDELPFYYNDSFIVGYFRMPSARFPKVGDLALGVTSVPPYWIFGANFAAFDRIELSANYRVYRGMLEQNFGKKGFGDDADRVGNVKFGILVPEDGIPLLPNIAFGLEDVIGTKRFGSQYVVLTKSWNEHNFECSFGWGWGRMKGPFGGVVWTPFRCTEIPILKDLSLIAEYDANDYKHHGCEHPKGKKVSSRINGGVAYLLKDTLQLSVSSVRGEKLAGSASIRFPLGSTCGLMPKVDDPCNYVSPVDTEPLGPIRPEKEFACDLAYLFSDQGLDLYEAYLFYDSECQRQLYLKVGNNRYRAEAVVRERIEDLLSSVIPHNISNVKVVVEAEGIESHSYCFRTCDLNSYRECSMGQWELETLSPKKEIGPRCDPYDVETLFERQREIWTLTFRPRLISFFGSTTGKYKYSLGFLGALNGIIPGNFVYKVQGSYSILSSVHGLTNRDELNPSEIVHVRTDSVKYLQEGRFSLEQLFLQRSWNVGRGWFFRLAGGYFEPAYGGGAGEILLYPVQSNWAIGIESALVWKRKYSGLGFTHEISRFNSQGDQVFEHFTGVQYFLDLHYDFKPLDLLFEVQIGQFLAKDKGARFQVTRYFPSGAKFSLWLTLTNAHDKVNGKTYFDKGFVFYIPFDIFLKQSSRTFLTQGMSAWLRDIGARALTGIPLYDTLYEERYD